MVKSNRKMTRNILQLFDNAPAHILDQKSVSTTVSPQPANARIIDSFKVKY